MKFTSHVNLPANAREDLIELLNMDLANAIDLHWQVKQAHWNIRGKHFISRHLLFDSLADHLRKQADALAERAGTLGGYAEGTIRLAAKNSQLPEYDLQAVDGDSHLTALVDRFSRYAASIRDGIQRSEALEDPVTVDLLTRILGEVELDLWFLESHLQGETRPTSRARREAEQPPIPHA
ncbi:DNA starvation/stationary phase protection protein Dps [Stigmatella aurantiaca]|uniref:DNA-binding protein, starvation-inducible n=1 Tax=Stigmatella aurantiaca (strain DW4/3-1) TaxID=378806 RepID=Q09AQ8_STIAD|nr:DNA starvation/stationary phase protection protein Dps [Stigmatella aurantiaca]ADO74861.1 Dps family protein [Stigmatella aurantiaca DW4/3-1]EAU68796.1 DNA-binding protein, starvation-inducible [Stigmatella aurantiaca DW4/3-1]